MRGLGASGQPPSATLRTRPPTAGFTLVEVAISMVIMSFIISTGLLSLVKVKENVDRTETKRILAEVEESLYGYALAFGRLPCPADPILGTGVELVSCALPTQQVGLLPWATLGSGAQDNWGNRFTYHVDDAFRSSFSCTTLTTSSITVNDGAGNVVASNVAAIIVSRGSRVVEAGADEIENTDGDVTYVDRPFSETTAGTNDFDDITLWISRYILNTRLTTVPCP